MKQKKIKILVTGHNGFIGSHIIKKLNKFQIITDSLNNKQMNIVNCNQVLKLSKADIVIHTAGLVPSEKNIKVEEFFLNNVVGTLNILEYCRRKKVKKIIFLSSYVYGHPQYSPIDEKHIVNPYNAYTKSKHLAEQLCHFYSQEYKIDVIILRPFNIYGNLQKKNFLISKLKDSLNTNKKVIVINKENKRDYLFIDDFTDLVLKLVNKKYRYEIFNVGYGKGYSFEEVINITEKIAKKKINVTYKKDNKKSTDNIFTDISKVSQKTGWIPKIDLLLGIKKVLENE